MRQRRGFTLVELSIVLVVIGLLIGGILALQSMISTAKISAQVRQIGQFDAGVSNFKTRFNYLPGDAPAFGCDGDGLIEGLNSFTPYDSSVNVYDCEINSFWYDIDPQNYAVPAPCLSGTAIQISGGKNVPMAKFGAGNSFFIASALGNGVGGTSSGSPNYYALLSTSQNKGEVGGYKRFGSTISGSAGASP